MLQNDLRRLDLLSIEEEQVGWVLYMPFHPGEALLNHRDKTFLFLPIFPCILQDIANPACLSSPY
jgi:hypothetical protein